MSKKVYQGIRETLQNMLKIEYDSNIKEMPNVSFFIDDENCKLMIKNYDSDVDYLYLIDVYFDVVDYNYIQEFQYLYTFNEFELIEFELNDWW